MAKQTQNDQILELLFEMRGELSEVKQIASDTKTQAEKTNGRVTKLEKKVFPTNKDVDAVQENGWENAFNRNLARVGLVMTAIAVALSTIGKITVEIIREFK